MNARHRIAIALLACLPLVACGGTTKPADAPSASTEPPPTSALGRVVHKEIREARAKLAKENIGLNDAIQVNGNRKGVSVFSGDDKDDRPKGEVTPGGDLLIDGKAVAINAEQRALLLDYRKHVIGVAESGMDIGVQGADLAAKAVGEVFSGLFSGKSEKEIEQSVEAEAARIKESAARLCARLPGMLASQQKAAAAIPEFRPYATMTQEDVDECREDSDEETASGNAAEEAAKAGADSPPSH